MWQTDGALKRIIGPWRASWDYYWTVWTLQLLKTTFGLHWMILKLKMRNVRKWRLKRGLFSKHLISVFHAKNRFAMNPSDQMRVIVRLDASSHKCDRLRSLIQTLVSLTTKWFRTIYADWTRALDWSPLSTLCCSSCHSFSSTFGKAYNLHILNVGYLEFSAFGNGNSLTFFSSCRLIISMRRPMILMSLFTYNSINSSRK